jgi:hypothetical protein
MMDLKEKLELLALAKDFTVKKTSDDRGEEIYEVESNDAELTAVVADCGYIEYYITGVSNHLSDYAMINIDELLKLKAFCEALVK